VLVSGEYELDLKPSGALGLVPRSPSFLSSKPRMRTPQLVAFAAAIASSFACEGDHSCYGPQNDVILTRNVRRMQPDAQHANNNSKPRAPLEWGQINFMHTTDTHGWLEGHIKEQNYGADWGDYASFTRRMKKKAKQMGVDLLLVDTGVSD
jgi:2',3'-cyclic-nucleotide 2'-phosphodiesterase (5'-nucleotidase family)